MAYGDCGNPDCPSYGRMTTADDEDARNESACCEQCSEPLRTKSWREWDSQRSKKK